MSRTDAEWFGSTLDQDRGDDGLRLVLHHGAGGVSSPSVRRRVLRKGRQRPARLAGLWLGEHLTSAAPLGAMRGPLVAPRPSGIGTRPMRKIPQRT